nr:MAG TPA: hypothetical protein [Caudoviricetes sp.]
MLRVTISSLSISLTWVVSHAQASLSITEQTSRNRGFESYCRS